MEFEDCIEDFKSDVRMEINEHFSGLISLIDIETEEIILKLSTNKTEVQTSEQEMISINLINEYNMRREGKIKKIKEIEMVSFDVLNDMKSDDIDEDDDIEEIYEIIFSEKHCIYLDNKMLEKFMSPDKMDGILVVSDFS